MHRLTILISLFMLFGTFAFAQSTTKAPSAAEEVLATVSKWADAVTSRDQRELDSLFADDLIVTAFDGTTRGKQEELKLLQPRENLRTVSVKNEDVNVRVFGPAAVVTGLVRMHFVISEKDVRAAYRYTAVFVKEEGRWRIAALQTANAPKEQK